MMSGYTDHCISFISFIYSLIAYLLSAPEYQPCTCYLFINRIPPSAPYRMIHFNKINNKKKKKQKFQKDAPPVTSPAATTTTLTHFQRPRPAPHGVNVSGLLSDADIKVGETLRGQFSNYNAANVLFPPRVGITFISPIRMHILFGYSNDQTHIKSDCEKGIDRSPDSCTPRL